MKIQLFAVMLALSGCLAADENVVGTFVVNERLDRNWRQQMLSFPVAVERGPWRPERVRVRSNAEWVAFQVSDPLLWEDGSLRSGTLWVMADLAPRGVLRWEAVHIPDTHPLPPIPATDLSVLHTEQSIELETSHLTVRLFEGEGTYDPSTPSSNVSPPQLAMIQPDGTAFGGGTMYGPDPIGSVSAKLTDTGPLFAQMVFRYVYTNGNTLELTARLNAGDNAVMWDAEVAQDRPDNGWRLDVSTGLPALLFPVMIEHFSNRECVIRGERAVFQYHKPVRNLCVLPLASHAPGLVSQLTAWHDWWDDTTQTQILFWIPDKAVELVLASRDPGAWVTPLPPGRMRSWGHTKPKMMPMRKLADGRVVLDVNLAAGELGGVRRWMLGVRRTSRAVLDAEDPTELSAWSAYNKPGERVLDEPGRPCPLVGSRLNDIQRYVLDWPADSAAPHPRLFISREDITSYQHRFDPDPAMLQSAEHLASGDTRSVPSAHDSVILAAWLATGDDEWAQKGHLVQRLEHHLGLLGGFDKMRHTVVVATLYDALIDTPLVPDTERPFLRAKMAYLAYQLADPKNWSMERGYCSGNPNMSVSHTMNLGIVAALLRDHPMAEEWAAPAISRFRQWMQDDVGPNGEWKESQSYVHVSTDPLMAFAIAARRAGLADFFAEGDFRKLLLYIAKMVYTAPDLQRGGNRVTAPMGRRPAGFKFGLTGLASKATADSDPEFSRTMQFVWAGTGYSRNITDARFGGFEQVLPDPDLPMENPHWTSERFPWWGAVLRHGYGTDTEHYLNLILPGGRAYAFRGAYGSIVKFISRGIPVGGTFSGSHGMTPNDAPRHELMQNRVTLARDWKDDQDWYKRFGMEHALLSSTFAALPRTDYVRADMRMTKDHELWPHERVKKMPPNVPAWPPVERCGRPPVDWSRQLVFVKDADPDGFSYLVFRDTVKGDQPTMWQFWTLSRKIGTPEEAGDRETFLADAPGASPTPWRLLAGNRFTAVGQFGLDVEYYIAAPRNTPRHTLRYGYTSHTPPNKGIDEYQDLLDVRLPGDGHYFIVLAPRMQDEAAPEFATLGDGLVVRVAGAFGTDYVFVADQEAESEADGIRFSGTAASVQLRGGVKVVSLGAAGHVRDKDGVVIGSSDGAVELQLGKTITVSVPGSIRPRNVTLAFPFEATVSGAAEGVELEPAAGDGTRRLIIPPGVSRVELDRSATP